MTRTSSLFVAALAAACLTGPAIAGELTGNGKDTPLNGASICQFSGQNDDPEGLDPENGPGGRTQSFGQDVAKWGHDPHHPVLHPGVLCNPNNLPMKDIGQSD